MAFTVASSIGEDWVSPSSTRNYMKGDPMLDWLQRYGYSLNLETGEWKQSHERFWHGYYPDHHPSNENYLPETDFLRFILDRGQRFEAGVIRLIDDILVAAGLPASRRVAEKRQDIADSKALERTLELMADGVPAIYQPVIWDAGVAIYGSPDLLVRSDVLNVLIPNSMPADDANLSASVFGKPWHYVVLDIKFTTLKLASTGELGNEHKAHKAQLSLYNGAMDALQGFVPGCAFLIGRGWEQGNERGASCFERMGRFPVVQSFARAPQVDWLQEAKRACEWVRLVRKDGHNWTEHSGSWIPEMRPNMSNHEDQPYHGAKSKIAKLTGEISALWEVGPEKRNRFILETGCCDWKDPKCAAEKLGLSQDKTARLERIMWINRDPAAPLVWPERIETDRGAWGDPQPVEFFVDFEFCTDLDDDFAKLPTKNGQSLIFMIGCGHVEDGKWQFKCFIADRLDAECELQVIQDWYAHMDAVQARLAPDGVGDAGPLVFHWSHAEESNLVNAYNSAARRHGDKIKRPNFYDFLRNVVKPSGSSDCVVVKGAFGFGLKAFGKAMHSHGLITECWSDGPTDGLGAMVGSWWCYEQAGRQGVPVLDVKTPSGRKLYEEIAHYNEVDCRVMYEIIRHLRDKH